MLVSWRRWVIFILLTISQVIGFLLFAKGFFPSKVVLPGYGEDRFNRDGPAQYNKLVFMVVDAMRSDFMFSEDSQMHFVHKLIREGKAAGFTAFSNPPTVTLPRLKGITTGSTPNFLDAILNIAEDDTSSTLGDQDSWIRQLHSHGKKIHMFGDDTWIKLFPTFFTKYEGTSSFYVADFTEVDNNVTRHINEELLDDSWDCLILHYLGLDHIGHKGGPLSPNMPVKQKEMDGIIEEIYHYVEKNDDTLFVVLGDHGMNEVGNHGGSSIGETSAALLAISSKFNMTAQAAPLPKNDDFTYYHRVQQIDLVPTLASLLNFPVPKNNLGIFIDGFKTIYNDKTYLQILFENASQLKGLVEHTFGKTFEPSSSGATSFQRLSNLWFRAEFSKDEATIKEFMSAAQSKLAESATNYNYKDIYTGFAIFAAVSFVFLFNFFEISYTSGNVFMASLFILVSLLISISNFGSSLVEEEYQIWWWFSTLFAVVLVLYLKPPRTITKLMAFVALLRVIRGWNNSGQKFNLASNLKVGKFLEDNDWNVTLIVVFYFAFLYFFFKTSGFFLINPEYPILAFLPIFTLTSFSLMTKLINAFIEDEQAEEKYNEVILTIIKWPQNLLQVTDIKKSLNPLFVLFYYVLLVVLGARFIWSLTSYKTQAHRQTFFSDFANIVTIFLLNQTSAKNVLLYGVFLATRFLIGNIISQSLYGNMKSQNIFKISLIYTSFNILIQNLSFFSLGNTNSLSTVDLTNAFNGLSDYDLIFCGILTFTSNWAGPIFWSLNCLAMSLENAHFLRDYRYDLLYYKMLITMVFYSVIGTGLLAACISLRFHLFIWTVFSPKLLYFASWYVLMNLGIDFIVSYLLILFY